MSTNEKVVNGQDNHSQRTMDIFLNISVHSQIIVWP